MKCGKKNSKSIREQNHSLVVAGADLLLPRGHPCHPRRMLRCYCQTTPTCCPRTASNDALAAAEAGVEEEACGLTHRLPAHAMVRRQPALAGNVPPRQQRHRPLHRRHQAAPPLTALPPDSERSEASRMQVFPRLYFGICDHLTISPSSRRYKGRYLHDDRYEVGQTEPDICTSVRRCQCDVISMEWRTSSTLPVLRATSETSEQGCS